MTLRQAAALCVLVACATGLGAPPAWAQPADPVVVVVAPGDSGIDPVAVSRAISRELGTTVTNRAGARTRGTFDVRANRGEVTVSYTDRLGRELTRTVALPDDPAQRVEVVAWLAGNLARDEAEELIAGMQAGPQTDAQPSPSAPAPPPKPPPAPPTKPPAAEREPAAAESPGLPPSAPRPQPLELPARAANLSLFHPVSLDPESHRRKIGFELGLVYSRIGALSGVGIALGHLRIDGEARGAVLGPLWTRLDGRSAGLFLSAIYGEAASDLTGLEFSGIVALTGGTLKGVQAAGIVNTTGATEGGQLAGIVNHASGGVSGTQLAGITNISRGKLVGLQASGITNLAGDVEGAQLAGFNRARGLDGFEAGIVNLANDTDGAQLGILNLAGRVRGVQVGLVNVADRVDGLSLAPVSIIREGRTELVLFGDTTIVANAGVRYSSSFLYSIFGLGWDPLPVRDRAFAIGAGIGAHLARFDPLSLDLDVLYRYVMPDFETNARTDRHSTAYRLLLGADVGGRFSLFATGGLEHEYDATHRLLGYGGAGLSVLLNGQPHETTEDSKTLAKP